MIEAAGGLGGRLLIKASWCGRSCCLLLFPARGLVPRGYRLNLRLGLQQVYIFLHEVREAADLAIPDVAGNPEGLEDLHLWRHLLILFLFLCGFQDGVELFSVLATAGCILIIESI